MVRYEEHSLRTFEQKRKVASPLAQLQSVIEASLIESRSGFCDSVLRDLSEFLFGNPGISAS
jgi:hypothetical protein